MKTNQLIAFGLSVSVAANIALAFALVRPASLASASTAARASGVPLPDTASVSQTAVSSPAASASQTAERDPASKVTRLWDIIGAADDTTLMANLRQAGFSPRQIRSIAQYLLDEKYRTRRIEVYGLGKDVPYWKSSNVFYAGDKRLDERRKLQQEITGELKSLVGDAYSVVDDVGEPSLRNQYGPLPSEKLEKIARIQQDYAELRGGLSRASVMLPTDRERLVLLDKEQRADLEKILSPTELFEYDLRNSPAASRLKTGNNELLSLTEAEYRSLFPIFQSIEGRIPPNTGANYQELQKAREAAEAQVQDQIKAALGEARYAEYKQANNRDAHQENRVVSRLGLPLSIAAQLVEMKQEYRDVSRAISTDKQLTREQKNEQLSALTKDSEAKITSLIGQRGLDAYREYGGSWLRTNAITTTTRVAPTTLPAPSHP